MIMIYFDDTFYSFVKKELKSQNVSFLNLNFSAKKSTFTFNCDEGVKRDNPRP